MYKLAQESAEMPLEGKLESTLHTLCVGVFQQ